MGYKFPPEVGVPASSAETGMINKSTRAHHPWLHPPPAHPHPHTQTDTTHLSHRSIAITGMSSMDVLALLNVTCAECLDLGPPPDSILAIPPPPLPGFLLRAPANHTTSCGAACDWVSGHAEFIELPVSVDGEDWEVPSGRQLGAPLDDTWLLVLVTSCVGVLVLGTLLALFLLRLKQERGAKISLQDEPGPEKGCEVLYPPVADSRLLWATLTPRGTTHHLTAPPPAPTKSFDNSAYVDAEEYLRIRPRVSSPTRIEHPNLPPLNLHRTFRREGSDTAPIV